MGVVKFGFEGDFEDARNYFVGVDSLFNRNVRMLEPIAVIDLFLPHNLDANLPHLEATVLIHEQSPEPWVRKATKRLRLYLALSQRLSGRLDAAQAGLEQLVADLPDDPDWLERSVRLNLVNIYLMRGARQKAIGVLDTTSNEELRKRLQYVLEESATAAAAQQQSLEQLQPWIRALYAGRYDEVAVGLSRWGDDPLALFYQAELELLRGSPGEAIAPLQQLLAIKTPERLRWYRYLAMLRLAEAYDRTGQRKKAESTLGEAIEFHSDRDLMRHVTKARQRWFEKGSAG
jgi:predicted Zn-dependent protease